MGSGSGSGLAPDTAGERYGQCEREGELPGTANPAGIGGCVCLVKLIRVFMIYLLKVDFR